MNAVYQDGIDGWQMGMEAFLGPSWILSGGR